MRLRLVAGAAVLAAGMLPGEATALPPSSFSVVSPDQDARVQTRTPTLTWSRPVSDAGPIRYEVRIDDDGGFHQPLGVLDDADCAATCSFTTSVPLDSMQHSVLIAAFNADGPSVAKKRFTVDVPPRILSIEAAAVFGLPPSQASFVRDGRCPLVRVQTDFPVQAPMYWLDGQRYTPPLGVTTIRRCDLAPGVHTIDVTVTDSVGNAVSGRTTFIVDLVHPAVRIEGPARVVKGTTATFRAVVDPNTVTAPVRFSWSAYGGSTSYHTGEGAEFALPVDFDSAVLELGGWDADGDGAGTQLQLVAGPKPPGGAVGVKTERYTDRRRTALRLTWPGGATRATITEGGRSRTLPVKASIPWTLGGSGERTVRVRFDWPLPAKTYAVRALVDTRPPAIASAVARGATLRLRARDAASGLARVQLATRRSRPATARPYRSTLRTRARWVRVIDRAGNRSAWHRIAHSG